MKITSKHNMTKQQAKDTVRDLLPDLMSRFGDYVSDQRLAWKNDLAEFSGRVAIFNISGTLQVTDTELVLDVRGIPFFTEGAARTEMESWFDANWPKQRNRS